MVGGRHCCCSTTVLQLVTRARSPDVVGQYLLLYPIVPYPTLQLLANGPAGSISHGLASVAVTGSRDKRKKTAPEGSSAGLESRGGRESALIAGLLNFGRLQLGT